MNREEGVLLATVMKGKEIGDGGVLVSKAGRCRDRRGSAAVLTQDGEPRHIYHLNEENMND